MTVSSKEYTANKGVYCPVCGSYDLLGKPITTDEDGQVYQKILCYECESRWDDRYQLTGYCNLEKGEVDESPN